MPGGTLVKRIWIKRAIFAALGGIAGYGYYAIIGCRTGTCPITSNPAITTLYGALVGVLLTTGDKTKSADPRS
jgi:hypothetical protein